MKRKSANLKARKLSNPQEVDSLCSDLVPVILLLVRELCAQKQLGVAKYQKNLPSLYFRMRSNCNADSSLPDCEIIDPCLFEY
jgi:hypothetical protein